MLLTAVLSLCSECRCCCKRCRTGIKFFQPKEVKLNDQSPNFWLSVSRSVVVSVRQSIISKQAKFTSKRSLLIKFEGLKFQYSENQLHLSFVKCLQPEIIDLFLQQSRADQNFNLDISTFIFKILLKEFQIVHLFVSGQLPLNRSPAGIKRTKSSDIFC